MSFAASAYFLLLLGLPFLAIYQLRRRRRQAIPYPSFAILKGTPRTWRQRLLFIPPLLLYLALAALITCLARPQVESTGKRQDREGIAIQLLVDVSSSMDMNVDTGDGRMTRMEVAKKVLEEFVAGDGEELNGRPNDMIGVISFARYSDRICPLTLGHDAVTYMIREITINTRPNEDGTAYGDATALAAAQLKSEEDREGSLKSKVILLLTDGENNCGQQMPLQAAAMAREWGIRIYTISLQEQDPPEIITNDDGEKFLKPEPPTQSDQVLEEMASMTGGIFRTAHDLDSLQSVYAEIDELEKTKIKEVDFKEMDEAFSPFAMGALALLLFRTLLTSTILRTSP
ncbi:vWA domain-containing protein [Luteolibacter sp. AS25]|uniref:vWA domain-containing protein n=1 Tax=Luteolibacter sp. AS25 TaxID=3135776 RepID=UPI00398B44EB